MKTQIIVVAALAALVAATPSLARRDTTQDTTATGMSQQQTQPDNTSQKHRHKKHAHKKRHGRHSKDKGQDSMNTRPQQPSKY